MLANFGQQVVDVSANVRMGRLNSCNNLSRALSGNSKQYRENIPEV